MQSVRWPVQITLTPFVNGMTTLVGYFIIVLLAFLILISMIGESSPQILRAQIQCAPYKTMAKILANKYDEVPTGIGLINRKRHMQIWRAADGSWTIISVEVIHDLNGDSKLRACVIAAGEFYEEIPFEPGSRL